MFNFLALLDIRVLVAYITIVASDWPRTFFTPKVFLFSYNYMLQNTNQALITMAGALTVIT